MENTISSDVVILSMRHKQRGWIYKEKIMLILGQIKNKEKIFKVWNTWLSL